ncbi:hypothetical protein [Flavobacterium piscisymbiosum]|uniref:Uncharacterized protein n=1 Tax=Flavobacterium piscisymbiosum TaxID=2893753 RepID=A0ABS8MET6_9FLAO|nr:hypothetical protein [Flavobacterium sp. F-30]MCC9063979.1 hypothetical protein [Flavobacterium sp. F-30]
MSTKNKSALLLILSLMVLLVTALVIYRSYSNDFETKIEASQENLSKEDQTLQ